MTASSGAPCLSLSLARSLSPPPPTRPEVGPCQGCCSQPEVQVCSRLLPKLTEVPLLLWDIPLSTFVSVGSLCFTESLAGCVFFSLLNGVEVVDHVYLAGGLPSAIPSTPLPGVSHIQLAACTQQDLPVTKAVTEVKLLVFFFLEINHARPYEDYPGFVLKKSGACLRSDFGDWILATTLKVGRWMWFHISCPVSGRTIPDGLKMKMDTERLQERTYSNEPLSFVLEAILE